MPDHSNTILEIEARLNKLIQQQASLIEEANTLRSSLNKLKQKEHPTPEKITPVKSSLKVITEPKTSEHITPTPLPAPIPQKEKKTYSKSSIEKFIGENLINKIGIIITILGVAIGAKYSIDNGLISPTARIIIGYIIGIGLLGFGMKLKPKYPSYSSVLVGGAMSIMYVITYMAYSLYDLFPQLLTFGLMLLFTLFTVVAALNFNKQIIALIGLVGAYAVPFLLSTGSGRVDILFTYIAIINIGILVVSIKKYWLTLYYSSFGMTWVIYCGWLGFSYHSGDHFNIAILFATIFYLIYYAAFLGYKLLHRKQFAAKDVIMLLLNSFIYFGAGCFLLDDNYTTRHLVGLFTVVNALIHFCITVLIFRLKLADKNLFYLISGLVLLFLTIAIPIQLDGNWVTLLWIGEAVILFWIGKSKNIPIYEKLSYPLMLLATISWMEDFSLFYKNFGLLADGTFHYITPIWNSQFLHSALLIAAVAGLTFINLKQNKRYAKENLSVLNPLLSTLLPIALIIVTFITFFLEITSYWTQALAASEIPRNITDSYGPNKNMDLRDFRTIWLINYTMVFLGILSLINIKKIKNEMLGYVNLILNLLISLAFLLIGLWAISELRESYIQDDMSQFFNHSWWNMGVRYLSLLLFAGLSYTIYLYSKATFIKLELKQMYSIILHVSIVWILSSELLNIMHFSGTSNNYKLALSILWGVYSLSLIAYGIWKDNSFLRIGAIGLFSLTLIKVFFYDIAHLSTISKTIVLVSLGVLLLIISFLYNKYKHLISYDDQQNIS